MDKFIKFFIKQGHNLVLKNHIKTVALNEPKKERNYPQLKILILFIPVHCH